MVAQFLSRCNCQLLLVIMLSMVSFSGHSEDWIDLEVGQSIHESIGAMIYRTSISNPEVAELRVTANEYVLYGLLPGVTSVDLWLENGKHLRRDVAVYPLNRGLLNAFLDIYLAREPDIRKFESPATLALLGEVSQPLFSQLESLHNHFPDLLLSQLRLREQAPEMIEVEVQVVEVKQRFLRQIGAAWPSQFDGPSVGLFSDWLGGDTFRVLSPSSAMWAPDLTDLSESIGSGHRAFAGWQMGLSTSLRALEERGDAQLLATPILRVESGHTAEFLSGGEIPIPQVTTQGAMDVSFRSYGIRVLATPELTPDGSIKTTIETEMSSLDPAVSIQGVPGLQTRRSSSVVVLKAGETLVLSGLQSQEQFSQRSGLPGSLERRWGLLTGIAERGQQATELMIFLTPRIVSEENRRRLSEQERRLAWISWLRLSGCRGFDHGGI
ncbi:MAG: pilus assembly protein N-terminal domain-containing protein [Idiomarina sp.]|nr:pilus assembly protein N-terminal domain-containing protein [Idiomarina sp.]